MRRALVAMTALVLLTAAAACNEDAAAGSEAMFGISLGERQLFLDDHGVAQIDNLTRTMHQPTKKGAVIRPDTDRGETVFQIRSAPCWDRDAQVFRFAVAGTGGPTTVTTIWESKDGLDWRRGAVSDRPFYCVVYDGTDPDPQQRYKSLQHTPEGLVPTVSPDMATWTPLDAEPISSSDEYNLSFDEKRHLFIATPKVGGPYGRSVALATSADFENWTDYGLVFHADDLDQELGRQNIEARLGNPGLLQPFYNDPAVYNVDVYNMGVFCYEGVYIGLPAMYHATGPIPNYPNTDGFHLVQLACSRDLRTWHRLGNRAAFIGPSPKDENAYDLTQLIGPSSAVLRGDELWFYYTGLKYRASWEYVGEYPHGETVPLPGLDRDAGAICLAVLRRDGFVSLNAGGDGGAVVTAPFRMSGRALFVNVEAPEGELRVDILDRDGSVVAVSAAIVGDAPRAQVKWQGGDVAGLSDQTVSLRFTLRNADLYSYWLE
ncbi:MAG: hypothetical protein JSV65_05715 [Armatimonadota bacterium]|nr:MAG: hypothetical protein JSV65_05715 [Armatimonadota bacterium]